MEHFPVMLSDVLEALYPVDGAHYVDGTFGRGGYSRAILGHADCKVTGIDRDPEAVACGKELEKEFPGRFHMIEGCFGDMSQLIQDKIDGVVLDIGVSSPQIDNAARGFSFREDGPLDMRMSKKGLSASDVINTEDEATIAHIFWKYGEERQSRRIARAIVADRVKEPFETTQQLAGLIRRVVKKERPGFDPATRSFQGLRIYVNDELGELERGLQGAEEILKSGGRLVVVTFHSLEDRIVKEFFKERTGQIQGSRHMPQIFQDITPVFHQVVRKAIKASDGEIAQNPRARSAKLRWAEHIKKENLG